MFAIFASSLLQPFVRARSAQMALCVAGRGDFKHVSRHMTKSPRIGCIHFVDRHPERQGSQVRAILKQDLLGHLPRDIRLVRHRLEQLDEACSRRGAARVTLRGALAMAVTAAVRALFGVTVG